MSAIVRVFAFDVKHLFGNDRSISRLTANGRSWQSGERLFEPPGTGERSASSVPSGAGPGRRADLYPTDKTVQDKTVQEEQTWPKP